MSSACYSQETRDSTVYVAGSGNTSLDQHLLSLLQQQLGENANLIPVSDDQVAMIRDTPIVTIGPSAFSRVRQANRDAPILAMLVKKDFIDGFASRSPGQVSGIFYDVPLIRQAVAGQVILPHATKIALLATTDSVELYEPLIDQLAAFRMTARMFVVNSDDDLIPTLVRALSYGDFLLAAPDDAIYNPRTIKHILLTAYRRNKIVIGPSQAYVRVGSLASNYAPFSAMVKKASGFIKEYYANGQLPSPAYPDLYRVEINRQVARSLNIPLPERAEVEAAVNETLNEHGGADVE
ncbi:ABC transporter substrate-binding protein [Marinobacter salinus]|uniref:ABC transporter substrate-binding protein n=2 Tax=Marinobacter salinus TaxID=1874317 RepID=A0A1D9GRC2_9GAMM|nr:ABC transporter substrate-binding protein [Marinobacter salinus]